MAEGMLRARLADAAPEVRVSSAGLMLQGHEADPYAVKVMKRAGVDIASHRSRVVNVDILEPADLIIGMERRHVREVSALNHEFFQRAFTLPELVLLAEEHGPRTDVELVEWAHELGRSRDPLDYLRDHSADEVPDPVGGSMRRFRSSARALDDLITRLVPLAWPESDSERPASPDQDHQRTP